MFKAVTTSYRCLPCNVSRVSGLLSSKRPLHNVIDVTRSTRDLEVDPQVIPAKQRRSFRPSEKRVKRKTRGIQERELTGPVMPISSRNQVKGEPKKLRRKFENSLAAQKVVRPAVQAARVQEICETGGLEDAIAFLTSAPVNTLNTVVWNTLMNTAMRTGRRKRAYEVYIEMKRRGFAPNARTFRTLLVGMAYIAPSDWASNSENLERCHKLYEALEQYVETCEKGVLEAESLYISHARASYITILGKTGNYQKIVDIFYRSGESGRSARDKYFYTALFRSLLTRTKTEEGGNLSVTEWNASDAKSYWRTLEKDIERGMEIDAQMMCSFIRVLAGGRPADQQLGLNLVRDYFGLAPPGEDAPRPRFPLTAHSLRAAMELCNKAKKFRLSIYFLKHAMKPSHRKTREIYITSPVVNEQLIALGQLAAVGSFDESEKAVDALRSLRQNAVLDAERSERPREMASSPLTAETVTLALAVCWRCGDWKRAAEIFSLATDCPAEDFLDDGPAASRSSANERPVDSRRVALNTSSCAYLTRTALNTGNKADVRQCLRMIWAHGVDAKEFESHFNFYKIELAKATVKLVDAVSDEWSKDEVKSWKDLRRESRAILSKRINIERPEQEQGGLGSDKYLGKLQQAIDFDLYVRSNRSI